MQTIRSVRERWLDAMRRHVADPTVALAITLIGDGLYYDSALHGHDPETRRRAAARRDGRARRLLERLAPGAARVDAPRVLAAAVDYSVMSISTNRSASIASRTRSSTSSGTGESTVSTLSAWPAASRRAICMPAMLMPASPNSLP